MSLRSELTGKQFSLEKRIRLFDMTVGATALYGTAAWMLPKDLERRTRSMQRNMFRKIVNSCRKVFGHDDDGPILESWVDWIRRTTHRAEEQMRDFRARDWVDTHYDVKQKWLKEIEDHRRDTWTYWTLHWQPLGSRRQARPRKRWTDE